jgi:hypothetical protein
MARMSREFKLVLLGAGILTAGSFLWPDPTLVEVAEKNAKDPAGGGTAGGHRSHMGYVMFIHPRSAPSRTMLHSSSPVIRSGFGGSGARFSAGG